MKKERRRSPPSRKRRALRRLLTAAAALFLANRILLTGFLLPSQALRVSEERAGTGRTSAVRRDWVPEAGKGCLVCLTENENVTMLSGAFLTWGGWVNTQGLALNCTEPAPIHGGYYYLLSEGGPTVFYVFGRIDDPDIARLEVLAPREASTLSGIPLQRTAFSWSSAREEWLEKDGRHYFLFQKCPLEGSGYATRLPLVAVGYDGEGTEIARVELNHGASSYL